MSHRFLIAVVVTSLVFVSDFGAGRPKTNMARAAEQKTTAHSSPPQMGAGRLSTGHLNTGFSGARSPSKSAVRTGTQPPSTMATHRTAAVLKGEVEATSSKVQQQLQASGNGHHAHHHHWHWGEYGYLPTNSSSLVVGVPNGNTLLVNSPGAVTQGVALAGVAAPVAGKVTSAAGVTQRVRGVAAPLAGAVLNPGVVQRIRLVGVAAPLAGQAFFTESQRHLSALAMGRHVRVFQTGVDANGAIVGQVFLANSGINLNERQIRDGMAFNSVNDGFASSLAAAEEAALAARTGLWKANHPVAPWLVTP